MMPENTNQEARDRASLVTKYVAVMLGNLCAISAIYFAVTNDFVMPQTAQVTGIWFMIWLIIMVLVHFLVKPWLEKWFLRNQSNGNR